MLSGKNESEAALAKLQTEVGDIEIPLIFNDPRLTEKMKEWRAIVENGLGQSNSEIIGLAEGINGEWLAVLRKKP